MNKNNIQIEDVMKKAYYLYKSLLAEEYTEKLKETSLDVAKEVHEIKKDYISIIRGLEEIFDDKTDNVQMNIKDLINIVVDEVKEFIRCNKLKIHVDFKIHVNFNVTNHYYLVTILRNLIYNSIEAIETNKSGYICIDIQKQREFCILSISDNGAGINAENMDYIFNAGFSTKFKEETGDICRGIGLAHVKGIVEEIFAGTIAVESEVGIGTKFTVKLIEEDTERDLK
ncbi:MAG: ATP-binding protein [Sedimentibacter sp.]|uniref:sensor histidine kinase n=1 Tax=Sedimentibacter sp. TaxID=1960295 RepID=UPI002980BB84|nr:ATP-binding protein [Sedimentibacter sp.]MDW5300528.1 ATP-binding protein [Sedimentibacter sp.]